MTDHHKGEIPVVVLMLPFIVGIVIGINYPATCIYTVGGLLILLSILFIGLNAGYNKLGIYRIRWLGGVIITCILLLFGWLFTLQHNELNNSDHFSKKPSKYLEASINSEPVVKGDWVRFTADVRQAYNQNRPERASGTILIAIKDNLAKNLFYGEALLIPARCFPIDPPFNPAEFNYKKYLTNKNIYYQAYLFPKQYVIIKAGQSNPVVAYALKLRQNLVSKLKANMRDTNAIAVASTLILGYKADLSNDILQSYSKTGTIHILSVSGGHVAILYVLFSFALGFLENYKHGRMIKAVIVIVLIWIYSLLTGFSPAVCRAALMISMIITGKTDNRHINTLNILAVSAFISLLYDPFLITDVGFQLSYLAVAGLIVLQPIVYKWFSFKNKWADNLWKLCTVSIAAQVITFPLSAYYFHQFPVYFLLSNLLIIIPVTVIMYTGALLLALPQMKVSQLLGYLLEHAILLMNRMLAFIERIPFAAANKIWLNTFEYVLIYMIIISLFYYRYERKAWLIKGMVVCMLALCISISIKKFRADETRSVTFLNLRKHTGIVFKNGRSGVILTDLPDTDRTFQYAVQPLLDSSRISNYKIYGLADSIQSAYLIKRQNLIQFRKQRLLLISNSTLNKLIPANLHIGYCYISHNPYIDNSFNTRSLLIVDGSNSEPYIDRLQNMAEKNNINYSILKRNKAISLLSE